MKLAELIWPTIAILAISFALTPYIAGALKNSDPALSSVQLQVLRDHVMARDRLMRDIGLATHELDIALGWIYRENGVDRQAFDIDLKTGQFIPYGNGRTPAIPPTFIK